MPKKILDPTEAQAELFDMVSPMLDSAHREITELAKTKQDGLLNELKVRHVNRLLSQVRNVLGNDPCIKLLELLDEGVPPQNSDAVLILGQWQAAMAQYRKRHFGRVADEHAHRWVTEEHPGMIKRS